jgi:hypothetical protein
MKAPSVEPMTAVHILAGLIAAGLATAVTAGRRLELLFAAIWSVAMTFLLLAVQKTFS